MSLDALGLAGRKICGYTYQYHEHVNIHQALVNPYTTGDNQEGVWMRRCAYGLTGQTICG